MAATPIGTLRHASKRCREILGSVQVIAAEDTRTTRKLLGLLDVRAPEVIAVHAHNESRVAERIAQRALCEEVALVSDAGTPGVSDPGALVIQAAHGLGVEIKSVPGPSALAVALAASGFPVAPSTFLGFAPRKGRDGFCKAVLAHAGTVVFFEAPGRVTDLVTRMAELAPDREACLCRELSKRFEENLRRPLALLRDDLASRESLKGECVVVVGPGEPFVQEAVALDAQGSLKDISQALANRWGQSRRDVYQMLLKLEQEQ